MHEPAVLRERFRRVEVKRAVLRVARDRVQNWQVEAEGLPGGGLGGENHVLATRGRVALVQVELVERQSPRSVGSNSSGSATTRVAAQFRHGRPLRPRATRPRASRPQPFGDGSPGVTGVPFGPRSLPSNLTRLGPAKGESFDSKVLTIAGLGDLGGGAGIQADLKAFAVAGCYGMSAIVALTAQHDGRHGRARSAARVRSRLRRRARRSRSDAAERACLLARGDRDRRSTLAAGHVPLVVDPVMIASSGARLLRDDAIETLVASVSLATVVTPNLLEAEALAAAPGSTSASRRADSRSRRGRRISSPEVTGRRRSIISSTGISTCARRRRGGRPASSPWPPVTITAAAPELVEPLGELAPRPVAGERLGLEQVRRHDRRERKEPRDERLDRVVLEQLRARSSRPSPGRRRAARAGRRESRRPSRSPRARRASPSSPRRRRCRRRPRRAARGRTPAAPRARRSRRSCSARSARRSRSCRSSPRRRTPSGRPGSRRRRRSRSRRSSRQLGIKSLSLRRC